MDINLLKDMLQNALTPHGYVVGDQVPNWKIGDQCRIKTYSPTGREELFDIEGCRWRQLQKFPDEHWVKQRIDAFVEFIKSQEKAIRLGVPTR